MELMRVHGHCWPEIGDEAHAREGTLTCIERVSMGFLENLGSPDAVGSVVSIISSIVSNVGVNAQKRVHVKIKAKPLAERTPYYRMGSWWLGLGLVVIGAIGDFIALGIASQALVTALGGGTTLAVNIAIAKFWLNEELSWWDVRGVAFIIIGAVTFAVTTPASRVYSLDYLLLRAKSTQFRVYLVAVGTTVLAMLGSITTSVFYRLRRKATMMMNKPLVRRVDTIQMHVDLLLLRIEQLESANVELTHDLAAERNERNERGSERSTYSKTRRTSSIASLERRRKGSDLLTERFNKIQAMRKQEQEKEAEMTYATYSDAFIYAACSGVMGAGSVIFAGCTSKTIVAALDGVSDQFNRIEPYVFMGGMFLCIFGQTALLNEALKQGSVMTIFPVFQAFFIGFGVVGGIVFYGTLDQYGVVGIILHGFAAFIMLVGIWQLMTHGRKIWDMTHDEDERRELAKSDERWAMNLEYDTKQQSMHPILVRDNRDLARLGSTVVQDSLANVFAGAPRSNAESGTNTNHYSRIALDARHEAVQQGDSGPGGERVFSGVKISV